MNKIKKCIAFLILMSFCGCLSSCYRPGSLGQTGYYDANYIAISAIPLFVNLGDDASNFDKVKLLDKDEYGRSLYAYVCPAGTVCKENDANAKYLTLLIICQSTNGNRNSITGMTVRWYDGCWLSKPMPQNDYAVFSDDEISLLKEQNDWGKPLDDSKMIIGLYRTIISYRAANDNDSFWAIKAEKESDREAVCSAVKANFKQYRAIGSNIYKNGYIFTAVVSFDGSNHFICFDKTSNTIKKEEQFDGDVFNCCDAFAHFVNSVCS